MFTCSDYPSVVFTCSHYPSVAFTCSDYPSVAFTCSDYLSAFPHSATSHYLSAFPHSASSHYLSAVPHSASYHYLSAAFTHSASSLASFSQEAGSWRWLLKCLLFIHSSFSSSTLAGLLVMPSRENPLSFTHTHTHNLSASSFRVCPPFSCPAPPQPSWLRNSATASGRNPLSFTHTHKNTHTPHSHTHTTHTTHTPYILKPTL